jgi:hypothetical protein
VLGVWLLPGTGRLYVVTGTDANWNEAVLLDETFALNVATQVKIEASGTIVQISYDGRIVSSSALQGTRLSGNAKLFASSPFSTSECTIWQVLNATACLNVDVVNGITFCVVHTR